MDLLVTHCTGGTSSVTRCYPGWEPDLSGLWLHSTGWSPNLGAHTEGHSVSEQKVTWQEFCRWYGLVTFASCSKNRTKLITNLLMSIICVLFSASLCSSPNNRFFSQHLKITDFKGGGGCFQGGWLFHRFKAPPASGSCSVLTNRWTRTSTSSRWRYTRWAPTTPCWPRSTSRHASALPPTTSPPATWTSEVHAGQSSRRWL